MVFVSFCWLNLFEGSCLWFCYFDSFTCNLRWFNIVSVCVYLMVMLRFGLVGGYFDLAPVG